MIEGAKHPSHVNPQRRDLQPPEPQSHRLSKQSCSRNLTWMHDILYKLCGSFQLAGKSSDVYSMAIHGPDNLMQVNSVPLQALYWMSILGSCGWNFFLLSCIIVVLHSIRWLQSKQELNWRNYSRTNSTRHSFDSLRAVRGACHVVRLLVGCLDAWTFRLPFFPDP